MWASPPEVQNQLGFGTLKYAYSFVVKKSDFTNQGVKRWVPAGWALLKVRGISGADSPRILSPRAQGSVATWTARVHARERRYGRYSGTQPVARSEDRHPFLSVRKSWSVEAGFDLWLQMWVEGTVHIVRLFLWRISETSDLTVKKNWDRVRSAREMCLTQ